MNTVFEGRWRYKKKRIDFNEIDRSSDFSFRHVLPEPIIVLNAKLTCQNLCLYLKRAEAV